VWLAADESWFCCSRSSSKSINHPAAGVAGPDLMQAGAVRYRRRWKRPKVDSKHCINLTKLDHPGALSVHIAPAAVPHDRPARPDKVTELIAFLASEPAPAIRGAERIIGREPGQTA